MSLPGYIKLNLDDAIIKSRVEDTKIDIDFYQWFTDRIFVSNGPLRLLFPLPEALLISFVSSRCVTSSKAVDQGTRKTVLEQHFVLMTS